MWHCDVQPVRLSVARICATPCVVVVVVVYLTRCGGGVSHNGWWWCISHGVAVTHSQSGTEQVGRQLSGEHQYTSCSAACSSTSDTYMKSPFKCTKLIVHILRVKSDLSVDSVVLRLVGTILECGQCGVETSRYYT